MDNSNFDNVNFEYDFTFEIHLQSLKITIMIVQIVPLTMF
jgi:hypothetical protein